MSRLEVLRQEAIDLQQTLASQPDIAVIDFQVAGGLLVAKRLGKFVQHIHAELSIEGRSVKVSFLQLQHKLPNQRLMGRRSQRD